MNVDVERKMSCSLSVPVVPMHNTEKRYLLGPKVKEKVDVYRRLGQLRIEAENNVLFEHFGEVSHNRRENEKDEAKPYITAIKESLGKHANLNDNVIGLTTHFVYRS